METLQTHPILVDLTDRVEKCQHGWPVEGSECPLCIQVFSYDAEGHLIKACFCKGIKRPSEGEALYLCGECGGLRIS
jgi:hypothetical protein